MSDKMKTALPTDSKARKAIPMARGLLDYFPAALAAVAEVSRVGNDKHNPGEPLHHARGKSSDHADCIIRHLMDRGTIDASTIGPECPEGIRHTAEVAWRALALLQEELEAAGAPLARGATLPPEDDLVGGVAGPDLGQIRPCQFFGCWRFAVQGGFCNEHKVGSK